MIYGQAYAIWPVLRRIVLGSEIAQSHLHPRSSIPGLASRKKPDPTESWFLWFDTLCALSCRKDLPLTRSLAAYQCREGENVYRASHLADREFDAVSADPSTGRNPDYSTALRSGPGFLVIISVEVPEARARENAKPESRHTLARRFAPIVPKSPAASHLADVRPPPSPLLPNMDQPSSRNTRPPTHLRGQRQEAILPLMVPYGHWKSRSLTGTDGISIENGPHWRTYRPQHVNSSRLPRAARG